MKRNLLVGLLLAVGLGQLAVADESALVSPQTLGSVEAILDKCAAIDPTNAAHYHDQVQLVTQGADADAVTKARQSDAYKQAYDSATESLGAVAAADAIKSCKGAVVAEKQ